MCRYWLIEPPEAEPEENAHIPETRGDVSAAAATTPARVKAPTGRPGQVTKSNDYRGTQPLSRSQTVQLPWFDV